MKSRVFLPVLKRTSFFLFLALFLLPAPYFGGSDPAALFAIRMLAFAALVSALLESFAAGKPFLPDEDLTLLKVPAIFFVFFLGYLAFRQCSLDGGLDCVLHFSSYAAFFLLCLRFFSARENVRFLIFLLALQIAFLIALGFYQQMSALKPFDKIYGFYPVTRGHFYSSFIDDDTYGAFLELAAPFFLGVVAYACGDRKGTASQSDTAPAFFYSILLPMMLVSCIHAKARLPFVALSLILAFFSAGLLFAGRKRRIAVFLGVFTAISFLFVSQVHSNAIAQLSDSLGSTLTYRFHLMDAAQNVFWRQPVFGSGWGAAAGMAGAAWKGAAASRPPHFYSNHLELLIETGMIGYALFVIPLGVLVVTSLGKCLASPSRWCRYMGVSSFGAITIFSLFLLADSHLRVPAVAMLWLAHLALLQKCGTLYPKGRAVGEGVDI